MRQLWHRLEDWLALTGTERKVILFLAASLLAGTGIRLYVSGTQDPPSFDYSASDSAFAELSRALKEDSQGTGSAQGKLNINTATDLQLESLPGIGPVLTERILQYRETHGPFKTVDELLNIKGMTKKRLEQIKNFITIERPNFTPSEE